MANHLQEAQYALDSAYWDKQYELNNTRWDIGCVSPPLKQYIDQITDKSISILIPGCGQGYEAEYLLDQGFENVTLIDISLELVEQLRLKFAHLGNITILQGDFFSFKGDFDLILEQTFFCAIDPTLRLDYVRKTSELLTNKGKLVGVLFNRDFVQDAPPYGGSKEQYQSLFAPHYNIKTLEECYNSISPRKDTELFAIFMNNKGGN